MLGPSATNTKKRTKNSSGSSPDVISNFTQKFTRELVSDAAATTKKSKKQTKKQKREEDEDDASFLDDEEEGGGDFDNVQGQERTTSTKFQEEYTYRAGANDDWRCMSVCDW